MSTLARVALSAALLLAVGCGDDEEEEEDGRSGFLTLDWILDSTREPFRCTALGAEHMEIELLDLRGATVKTATAACSSFITDVALPVRQLRAVVTLVDPAGEPVIEPRFLQRFRVFADAHLNITVRYETPPVELPE